MACESNHELSDKLRAIAATAAFTAVACDRAVALERQLAEDDSEDREAFRTAFPAFVAAMNELKALVALAGLREPPENLRGVLDLLA